MTPSSPSSADSTRRQVLIWGGVGVAASFAGYLSIPEDWKAPEKTSAAPAKPVPVASAEDLGPAPAPTAFDREIFVPHLNSNFTLQQSAVSTAACELVEVSPATEMKTQKGTFVSFSLVFAAPNHHFLINGGTCRVKHPELAEMEFFLSPVGNGKKKHLIEACFTQRV